MQKGGAACPRRRAMHDQDRGGVGAGRASYSAKRSMIGYSGRLSQWQAWASPVRDRRMVASPSFQSALILCGANANDGR